MAKSGAQPKGGSSGGASNAALHDDEDLMSRRLNFNRWKKKKQPNRMIDYVNSPRPPIKKS